MTTHTLKTAAMDLGAYLPSEQKCMRALAVGSGVLFLLYVYFVGTVVFKTIDRKVAETKIRDTRALVAQSEMEYLALTSDLDLSKAKAYGLTPSAEVTFAARTTNAAVAQNTNSNAF